MHTFLVGADINLIGTSHNASEAVVLHTTMIEWFRDRAPGTEPVFIPQAEPWA
jgi:hypothetical protein